jgi:hypothetical protein
MEKRLNRKNSVSINISQIMKSSQVKKVEIAKIKDEYVKKLRNNEILYKNAIKDLTL